MKKRLFSILLALCMVLCFVPTTAFAESETEEPPVCSCETACTAEAMNAECPVCGADGALAENCGKYAAEESGQNRDEITGRYEKRTGKIFEKNLKTGVNFWLCLWRK